MSADKVSLHPLPQERVAYMQQLAYRLFKTLEEFTGGQADVGPIALQALDEWIERQTQHAPLSNSNRVMIIAFVGQVFIGNHGGRWALRIQGRQQSLGVACLVAGPKKTVRFVDISEQISRRLEYGIAESLTFFYLTTSVDLQGRS